MHDKLLHETHGDEGHEKQQPVSSEKFSMLEEQDGQGRYRMQGGYIGKQLASLGVFSRKTAGAEQSFRMGAMGENILNFFSCIAGQVRDMVGQQLELA